MRVNANMLILLTSSRSTFDPTKIDQQPKKQHFVRVAAIFLIALKELIFKSLEIDKIKVSDLIFFLRQICFDKYNKKKTISFVEVKIISLLLY